MVGWSPSVLVVDEHSIYRRGLVSALTTAALADVIDVATAADARVLGEQRRFDVVVVDREARDLLALVRAFRHKDAAVIVISARSDDADVLDLVAAGVLGYLAKDGLTPEALDAAVRAAARGCGVLEPGLLGRVLRDLARVSDEVLVPRGIGLSLLNERERATLRLVAAGLPIREVAVRLSYSERTIKNVLHDATAKLGARSRSQAVAFAVRDGLI